MITRDACCGYRETFCWLPLAYVLNSRVMVLHGGLFKEDGVKLDDIRAVDRFREPPDSGIMCDCLWSDPQPENGRAPSKRGCGVQFGAPHRHPCSQPVTFCLSMHKLLSRGLFTDLLRVVWLFVSRVCEPGPCFLVRKRSPSLSINVSNRRIPHKRTEGSIPCAHAAGPPRGRVGVPSWQRAPPTARPQHATCTPAAR